MKSDSVTSTWCRLETWSSPEDSWASTETQRSESITGFVSWLLQALSFWLSLIIYALLVS